ncbi:hypothetical protein HZS_7120, partial [Henneguya salminicola]
LTISFIYLATKFGKFRRSGIEIYETLYKKEYYDNMVILPYIFRCTTPNKLDFFNLYDPSVYEIGSNSIIDTLVP